MLIQFPSKHHQQGSAVLIVLALLVCIMLFLQGTSTLFHSVDQQLDHMEAAQIKRLTGQ